jgi:putative sterol carrier protein
MTEILLYLERIRARFSNPEVQETFKDFTKTLQFEFPDTGQIFLLTVVNGNATLTEGATAAPDIKITANTDVLAGILDKKINPIMAFMSRKIKSQGAQEDVMKLQKLML